MAWLSAVPEDEGWRQAMEEAMGCAPAKEFSFLQKRRSLSTPFSKSQQDTHTTTGIRRQPHHPPLQHHQRR